MILLHEVEVPRWPFGRVSLFVTPEKAVKHLCDHVLTRPEAEHWARLLPALGDILDPEDPNALFHFARSLWSSRPPVAEAQRLYDDYASAIVRSMTEAIRQGWYWAEEEESGPSWRGLGATGTFTIWQEHAVRTGMLLGYSAPPGERPCPRRTNPLPRQNAWRPRGQEVRRHDAHHPRIAADRLHAMYHVFKKGAVRVRREFKNALAEGRVVQGGAYLGSLRDGVPDFETWLRLAAPTVPLAGHGPHVKFSCN